ncbi:hypothetical protein [Brevundimonas sp. TWP3-1-2b1]|uniref:hypothetical protein n=1 Tax=Brevundimonas sp. TWP3-1-2b1 TaxID=2804650 RepID=UPI003CF6C80C
MGLSLNGGKGKSKTKEVVDQTQVNTLSDRASGLLTSGIGNLQGKSYRELDPTSIARFTDPYNKDVRDATMGQLGYERDVAANKQKAEFARAGAFGDDRRAVYEAELGGQYDRTAASTLAGLNSAGYSQALGAAQTENQDFNQYNLGIQELINQLISQFGNEGTSRTNGMTTGSQTGYQFGFNGSPFGKQAGG